MPSAVASTIHTYTRVLGNSTSRLVLGAALLGNVGSWMRAAVLTVFFAQEHALVLLAIFMATRQASQMLLLPILGVWVDRLKKRVPMVLCLIGSAVCTLLAAGAMHLDPPTSLATVFVLSITAALAVLIYSAFMMAVIPMLYASDGRPVINSMLGGISTLALTAGPALTGIMLIAIEPWSILLIDAAMLLLSALLVHRLPIKDEHATEENRPSTAWTNEIFEGARFVSSDKRLVALVCFGGASFAGVGATWVINPALTEARGFDTPYIGYVMATIGLGSFLGMLAGGFLAIRFNHLRVCAFAVLVFAGLFFLWGQIPGNYGALLWLAPAFFMGLFACIHEASYWTLIQNTVPQQMMGRVTTGVDSLTLLGTLIGTIGAGYTIGNLGAAAATTSTAVLMLGLWLVGITLFLVSSRKSRD